MSNPFDDPAADYLILVNGDGQYCLWPTLIDIPNGWALTGPRGSRPTCLEWIEAHWVDDMMPASPS